MTNRRRGTRRRPRRASLAERLALVAMGLVLAALWFWSSGGDAGLG